LCSSPRSGEGSLDSDHWSRAKFEDAARDATVTTSLKDLQVLRNTSNSRGPMLDLMDRYYVADGNALHQAKLYTAISGLLDPTEIFDYAISATALTRCGQANHDDRVVLPRNCAACEGYHVVTEMPQRSKPTTRG
jgi:hypothetical protein